MEKKDLLKICEGLNIDIIWKAWKDDIIRTTIDVQDKLAKYDPVLNRAGAVAVTQYVSGYESLEPLPTANPRSERATHYGLFLKNDLVTRCQELKVNMGFKSGREELIEAILNAEDKAGPSNALVGRIRTTLEPTKRPDDRPMARHERYYKEKSRKFIRRRCKTFGISRTKSKLTSQLIRDIIEVEGRTSGMQRARHVYVSQALGELAPPMPPFGQIPAINSTEPTFQTYTQVVGQRLDPHSHISHEDIRVVYPDPAPTMESGSGCPLITGQLDPVYERYRDQTQMPIEITYEPLYRTPRMMEAAARYNDMTLSQLRSIIHARSFTRSIEQDCYTKLDCIDILVEDDRKHGLLPAASTPVYSLEPGKLVDINPDPQIFIRKPTVMQVSALRDLQTSDLEAEEFQFLREAFYEPFSQQEMEKEVHARRVIYAPTVRRQLVRSDMRMFERVRRRAAGLDPRRG